MTFFNRHQRPCAMRFPITISLNLPMSGTIRVADVNFSGQGFGPVAIDNIQVHRLNLKISP